MDWRPSLIRSRDLIDDVSRSSPATNPFQLDTREEDADLTLGGAKDPPAHELYKLDSTGRLFAHES
jgi:hypothetical protein